MYRNSWNINGILIKKFFQHRNKVTATSQNLWRNLTKSLLQHAQVHLPDRVSSSSNRPSSMVTSYMVAAWGSSSTTVGLPRHGQQPPILLLRSHQALPVGGLPNTATRGAPKATTSGELPLRATSSPATTSRGSCPCLAPLPNLVPMPARGWIRRHRGRRTTTYADGARQHEGAMVDERRGKERWRAVGEKEG